MTVITQNGTVDLSEHSFRMLYSRRDNERLLAIIVAEKDGAITAKIQPTRDGKDQLEAFKELRREVELRLNRILLDIPSVGDATHASLAGLSNPPSKGARIPAGAPAVPARPQDPRVAGPGPMDEPPAYGNVMGDHKIQR